MKALIQTAGLVTVLWGISIPLPGLFPASAVLAAPVKAPAKNAGLQKLFRRGMDAYDAKSYEDAVDLFTQLLQKQADYTPAKIQLARALYQLKRFAESFKLFQQIEDVSILEPDASYEYGQAAFRANDFPIALKAFRNVPNGHPLFDLAGYYGGISAFKQAEYQLALDLFEQAVVLPSKLLKSQKLYQKEAERLLIQQQKQELQNSLPQPGVRTAGGEEAQEPPKPFRYLAPERGLSLRPRLTSQSQQTFDKTNHEHVIKGGIAELNFGVDRNATVLKAPHFLFQADVSAMGLEGGTQEILALPDANAEQERFVIARNNPRSLFTADAGVAVEWAIATGTSLGLVLSGRGIVPGAADGDPKAATVPRIGIFLTQKNNNLETLLKTDFYAFAFDGDVLFTNARQVGRIDYFAQNKFRFGLQGELSEYAYNVDRVNGPDWQGRISTEIGYGTEQGFRFGLGAFYEITESQRFHDLGPVSIIEFNASSFGARFHSEFAVVKYVDIGLEAWTMDRSTGRLSPNNESTVDALHAAFPTFISTLSLHINIHTGF